MCSKEGSLEEGGEGRATKQLSAGVGGGRAPGAGQSKPIAILYACVCEGPGVSCSLSPNSWLTAVCALPSKLEGEARERSRAHSRQASSHGSPLGMKPCLCWGSLEDRVWKPGRWSSRSMLQGLKGAPAEVTAVERAPPELQPTQLLVP